MLPSSAFPCRQPGLFSSLNVHDYSGLRRTASVSPRKKMENLERIRINQNRELIYDCAARLDQNLSSSCKSSILRSHVYSIFIFLKIPVDFDNQSAKFFRGFVSLSISKNYAKRFKTPRNSLIGGRARSKCELLPIINIDNRQFVVKQGIGHLFIFRLRR